MTVPPFRDSAPNLRKTADSVSSWQNLRARWLSSVFGITVAAPPLLSRRPQKKPESRGRKKAVDTPIIHHPSSGGVVVYAEHELVKPGGPGDE